MSAQLLNKKFFQKVPPIKLPFILYLAIQTTAVLMLMLRLAQVGAQVALLALQRVDKLAVTLLRQPESKVVLWVSVKLRGKTLLTHCACEELSPRQGLTVLVSTLSEGTQLSSSEYVRFNCTPLLTVKKSLESSWYPQLQLYSQQGKKGRSQSAVESTLDPPFFMFNNLSVTLVPQTQVLVEDQEHEEQQIEFVHETSVIRARSRYGCRMGWI